MTTLTREELIAERLWRQGLTSPLPDPLSVVERIFAVQSQYPASVVPAIFARCPKATDRMVQDLLFKSRTLVRTWSLRQTVHAHRAADLGLVCGSTGACYGGKWSAWLEMEHGVDLGQMKGPILEALAAGPLFREELRTRVPELAKIPHAGWGMDVKEMAYEGKLIFAEQNASRTKFASCQQWLGDHAELENSMPTLLRRYLEGHGPATKRDFKTWVGMYVRFVNEGFDGLENELEEVRVQGSKEAFYRLRATQTPPEPKGLKLLPKFDELVMGWFDRTYFMEAKDVPKVVRPAGQIEATILLDGRIIGTWRAKRDDKRYQLTAFPFKSFSKVAKGKIEAEAGRLGKALGAAETQVTF